MTPPLWFPGDTFGLDIPADSEGLRAQALSFLTDAFRATSTLDNDNRVTQITRWEECSGGSTGRKLILSVAYERHAPNACTDLSANAPR